ncbi:DUF6776 family protein [Candidatus Berkiella aquae]|uniref:Uncharacterized protein n=1 Tax=Candidatus Berkiella aquae TaxID=295108 RepID=A0A0Q9YUT3_9GAMM|nr:DUF6776 family protein [Candidatus Berkiella aquae]MCS5710231.1 hypothetical protein [Candidatus Berkiella aquae]
MREKPGRRLSLGTCALLLVIVGVVTYRAALKTNESTPKVAVNESGLQEQVQQLTDENQRIQKELIIAKRNFEIESEAKKNLGGYLRTLQANNAELAQHMNLYQSVSGVMPVKQGVQIKNFQIFPNSAQHQYRYLVVLSKQFASAEYIEGLVTMTIVGKVGDKTILLPVKYVNSGSDDGLSFKFRYLQELSGELTLPPQFLAEGVLVAVKPERGWPSVQQQFPWLVHNSIQTG